MVPSSAAGPVASDDQDSRDRIEAEVRWVKWASLFVENSVRLLQPWDDAGALEVTALWFGDREEFLKRSSSRLPQDSLQQLLDATTRQFLLSLPYDPDAEEYAGLVRAHAEAVLQLATRLVTRLGLDEVHQRAAEAATKIRRNASYDDLGQPASLFELFGATPGELATLGPRISLDADRASFLVDGSRASFARERQWLHLGNGPGRLLRTALLHHDAGHSRNADLTNARRALEGVTGGKLTLLKCTPARLSGPVSVDAATIRALRESVRMPRSMRHKSSIRK